MRSEAASPQAARYLVVRTGGRLCALPLASVIEVMRVPAVEAANQDVVGLLGFTRLRGEPAAVFSLSALLGLTQQAEAGTARRAVRICVGQASAAVVVDEVIGIQTVAPADLARISLPGGQEQQIGRFDREFASMIELGGLLPAELPTATATPSPGMAAG